jgi:hypothetical protein
MDKLQILSNPECYVTVSRKKQGLLRLPEFIDLVPSCRLGVLYTRQELNKKEGKAIPVRDSGGP